MKNTKTTISKATTYEAIGEFWDNNDLTDNLEKTKKIDFKINVLNEINYCAIEKDISNELHSVAHNKGISTDTLINLWLKERLIQTK